MDRRLTESLPTPATLRHPGIRLVIHLDSLLWTAGGLITLVQRAKYCSRVAAILTEALRRIKPTQLLCFTLFRHLANRALSAAQSLT